MSKLEEHPQGRADTGGMLEHLCRAVRLPLDSTPRAERNADCELVASWLEAIHNFKVDPFASPIVSASLEESSEDS